MANSAAFAHQHEAIAPAHANQLLDTMDAESRVAWTLEHFPERTVLSSSFGAQSAVMLHMASRQQPDLPIVLIDTGYLFPETYRFVDKLTERLGLNLHVYRSQLSLAGSAVRPPVGAGGRRTRTLQSHEQSRTHAARACGFGHARVALRDPS